MTKDDKRKLTKQKLQAFLAAQNPPSDLRAAGWTPSDLRAAGWTPSDLRAAGWTPSALIAAGWTPSDLIAAGWTPSALIAAGWTPSDLRAAEKLWESIPKIEKPYSRMLADIEEHKRIHDQSTFGPDDFDPKRNVCKTPMCTAGHLVNMGGEAGYNLRREFGWETAALMIHMKSRPDAPPQNYGGIPQEWALAYIRERAEEETAAE